MKFTGLSDSDKGAANMFDHPESGDFDMTNELRSGLIAISIFAYLSFFVSTTLFIYLLYKMISWRMRQSSRADRVVRNMPGPPVGEEFTVEDRAFGPQGQDSKAAHEDNITRVEQSKKRQPNQFLVLVHNLLLADMHQATSFLLSTTWLQKGGIYIEERSCWVQGFFDSNGDLASSCFITAIAIHTYLSLVKNWRPPQWGIYLGAALIWLFVYSMSVLPLLITRNGRTVGGYYVRAGAWCWINETYEDLRLFTHYIFIFISLVTTTVVYVTIFFTLRHRGRSSTSLTGESPSKIVLSHHPAFLLYPVIYVTCTLPLALGRIAHMAGADVPMGYFCFAGAAIASNGWCDALLFGTTRHAIIFGSKDGIDNDDTGLETFAFMRTPAGKRFGNTIWIQGGGKDRLTNGYGVGGWWQRLGGSGHGNVPNGLKASHGRTTSEESLRSAGRNDMAIQMDVVTSVAVEVDGVKGLDIGYSSPATAKNPSLSSGDREYGKGY